MRHIHWLLSFTFTQLCFGRLHELHLLSERCHSNSSEWNSNVTLSSLFRHAAFVPFTNALGQADSAAEHEDWLQVLRLAVRVATGQQDWPSAPRVETRDYKS
jgi:hypothetical protein